MFQMKFYAVALFRSRGVLPARLRLIYLADGQLLDYSPDHDELLRFEKTLMAIWRAINPQVRQAISAPARRGCASGAPSTALSGVRWDATALPGMAGVAVPDRAGGMNGCYYRRLGTAADFQVFGPTDYTRSNWDPEIQHGSPPLALLTKLIEELSAGSGLRVGRLSLDILGAIPVTPVRARAWVERRARGSA